MLHITRQFVFGMTYINRYMHLHHIASHMPYVNSSVNLTEKINQFSHQLGHEIGNNGPS